MKPWSALDFPRTVLPHMRQLRLQYVEISAWISIGLLFMTSGRSRHSFRFKSMLEAVVVLLEKLFSFRPKDSTVPAIFLNTSQKLCLPIASLRPIFTKGGTFCSKSTDPSGFSTLPSKTACVPSSWSSYPTYLLYLFIYLDFIILELQADKTLYYFHVELRLKKCHFIIALSPISLTHLRLFYAI